MKIKPTVTQLSARKRSSIYAVFENIRSRYNVGAMFRTSGATPCPPHKLIDKSALGATDVVPWEYASSSHDVISLCDAVADIPMLGRASSLTKRVRLVLSSPTQREALRLVLSSPTQLRFRPPVPEGLNL